MVVLGTGAAMAAGADFSRYQSILDRRPFGAGEKAEAGEPARVTMPAQAPSFVKGLRMCAITESDIGTRVGFVEIGGKTPKSYYLYVGDVEDGIQLVDADYEREGALLRKGDEQYWIYMRENQPTAVSEAMPPGPSGSPARSRVVGIPAPGERTLREPAMDGAPLTAGGARESYAERRRRRLDEMRQRVRSSREIEPEDLEQRLQDYQMHLIRSGKTPLPIPLTPEADQKLVDEGVLPPVEASAPKE